MQIQFLYGGSGDKKGEIESKYCKYLTLTAYFAFFKIKYDQRLYDEIPQGLLLPTVRDFVYHIIGMTCNGSYTNSARFAPDYKEPSPGAVTCTKWHFIP